MKEILRRNIDELTSAVAGIQAVQAEAFLNALRSHPHIFVLGSGRSGMVMSMFSMRLMHLGLDVHRIGESTTPAIRKGDLLIIGSGSGETENCLRAAGRARDLGATRALLTAVEACPLGKMSDVVVVLPSPSKNQPGADGSPLLAGTLFEQSLLVFSDCICAQLAREMGKDSSSIMELHTNIE